MSGSDMVRLKLTAQISEHRHRRCALAESRAVYVTQNPNSSSVSSSTCLP